MIEKYMLEPAMPCDRASLVCKGGMTKLELVAAMIAGDLLSQMLAASRTSTLDPQKIADKIADALKTSSAQYAAIILKACHDAETETKGKT